MLTLRAFARPLLPSLRRSMTTVAAETALPPPPPPHLAVETYSRATSALHWAMGLSMIACIGTVQVAMRTKDNEQKGQIMNVHKSFGLLTATMVPLRIALFFLHKRPGPVPGSAHWEHLAASASHIALYGLMVVMPASGIAMGYYGGKGLPFFGAHIPGSATPNGGVAKNAFKVHKQAGLALEFLLPAHVGGAMLHYFKGHTIFARVNPFA